MHDDRLLIQRARTAGLLDRLRIKIGLPVEFYLQAVHPVIESYATHVLTLPSLKGDSVVDPGCRFMDGLELACIALDFRRRWILPPKAAPEDIGERAHRWTYAVFVAALMRQELTCGVWPPSAALLSTPTVVAAAGISVPHSTGQGDDRPANPLLLFRRMVPGAIQAWLGADHALLGELHAYLLGDETSQRGTFDLLLGQAVRESVRHRGADAATFLSKSGDEMILPTTESVDRQAVPVCSATPPVRRGPECNAANRFMEWLTRGIKDESIRINEASALVHFVSEGMLLVSPRIFRDFARRYGEDGNGAAPTGNVDDSRLGKGIQRQVLRAGWHRKADHGNNIQSYDVMRNGRPVSGLSGVLITKPERFVSPVPAANPMLVRRVLA